MILTLLFIAACFLAYSNGANDNFKGVATLFGSGTAGFKKAIGWATITTFSGSIAAIYLAETLVKNFSGKGLVPNDLILNPTFAISIAIGAALTVIIATKIGMPISTTHSLVGALFGTGIMALGFNFNFAKLGKTFLMPLIVSPLMAAVISALVYIIFKHYRKKLNISKNSGIYIPEKKESELIAISSNKMNIASKLPFLHQKQSIETYSGTLLGISSQRILDNLHFFKCWCR